MQVEYEDAPGGEASSVAPPADEGERDGSDVEDQDEEGGPNEDRGPAKKKRVTKSRQSLAEKSKGTTIFPLTRVKRIIKADKDLDIMSSEATFLIAVATEYFIKHFMEEGYTKARLERRRIVNYKDLANVVARSEEFEFLRNVTPLPITLTEALERRKQKMVEDEESPDEQEDEEEVVERPAGPIERKKSNPSPVIKSEALPPLALSTNPLFPNAIVKRPSNTHARGPVPQPPKPAPPPPVPRVHTGKNAPSTPISLTTRGSARRSMNLGETTPTVEAAGPAPPEDAMEVDD